MSVIAVYFDAPEFGDYPFDDPSFRAAYEDIGRIIARRGATFCVVRAQRTYRGGRSFSGGWIHDGEGFVRKDEEISVDLLWNKEHFHGDPDLPVLNAPELEDICDDKSRTYGLFADHCPRTVHVRDRAELSAALGTLTGQKLVFKPLDGEGGKGVVIAPGAELLGMPLHFPGIAQEFIDTSGGIPGIVAGLHDLRVISVGGLIAASYVRTPPPGKLLANVAQGGAEITVPIDRIPEGALQVFRAVDGAFTRFPARAYSVDMGLDRSGRWMIIELNAKPGPPSPDAGPSYVFFLEMMADLLLSAALPA